MTTTSRTAMPGHDSDAARSLRVYTRRRAACRRAAEAFNGSRSLHPTATRPAGDIASRAYPARRTLFRSGCKICHGAHGSADRRRSRQMLRFRRSSRSGMPRRTTGSVRADGAILRARRARSEGGAVAMVFEAPGGALAIGSAAGAGDRGRRDATRAVCANWIAF
jgi:hypothetical protein